MRAEQLHALAVVRHVRKPDVQQGLVPLPIAHGHVKDALVPHSDEDQAPCIGLARKQHNVVHTLRVLRAELKKSLHAVSTLNPRVVFCKVLEIQSDGLCAEGSGSKFGDLIRVLDRSRKVRLLRDGARVAVVVEAALLSLKKRNRDRDLTQTQAPTQHHMSRVAPVAAAEQHLMLAAIIFLLVSSTCLTRWLAHKVRLGVAAQETCGWSRPHLWLLHGLAIPPAVPETSLGLGVHIILVSLVFCYLFGHGSGHRPSRGPVQVISQ
mmetsp:Transcript_18242/g.53312  ORF Transcript_18242/g.53312 Transcript_18242/m.53312 type:complete len:265 (+) Transcript_18242:1900-2694(+)